MNNKGFTLVELLVVIVILTMLISVVSISINPVIEKYKKELSEAQINTLEESAHIYYLKEGIKKSYDNRSFKMCVNVSYLIENDYIEDESVVSSYEDENFDGSVEITHKSDQFIYKYNENNCTYEYEVIDLICTAVTEETKTTGNIPQGKYLPGDEYICEVKNNTKYHFFVISTEKDNVNLIMERNMYYDKTNDVGLVATETNTGVVAWSSNVSDNSYGPVTAIEYLHNATKDWDNIPNMIMNYQDENNQQERIDGYGGIKTIDNITIIMSRDNEETGRIENLKTRLPKYDEVHGINKCLTYYENETKYGSCPIWLVNYLSSNDAVIGQGIQNIEGILGYWLLSSYRDSISAWSVYSGGIVEGDMVHIDEYNGVRPVISIPKIDIAN